MKRAALILGVVVLVAGMGVAGYDEYHSLKQMRAELRSMHRELDEASRLAQEESAAAAAADKQAQEAATRAESAAQSRDMAQQEQQKAQQLTLLAEQQKVNSDTQRAQAEAAAQQAAQHATQAENQLAQMRQEREEELNQMQAALDRIVETHRTPNGMVIVLPNSSFRFAFDSADLSQRNRELLSRIAGILLVSKGYGLSVFGYTDDVGTQEYNQQLSTRRAKAVQDYLVKAGIDASLINSKGYGKTSPLVNGTSADDRAKNRRVEIALTDSRVRFGKNANGN